MAQSAQCNNSNQGTTQIPYPQTQTTVFANNQPYQMGWGGTYQTQPAQQETHSAETGDPNPDVCEDCGGPLSLSDHIREQIHLRRQFIFEELDKLDRQERNLDNENISSILDLLEDYTDL